MASRGKAARKPQTGKRTAAGQKDSHVRPRKRFDAVEYGVEVRPAGVLGRNFNGLPRPLDPKSRIVEAQAALLLGSVERIHQIERLGVVGERHDAVRKTLRNENHPSVFGGEFDAEPFAEGRRVRPQIDDGVIEGAADAAHHLDFRSRRQLIMHPAQGAGFRAQGVVDLNDRHRHAGRFEFLLAKEAREKAAVVAALFEFDRVGAMKRRRMKLHDVSLSRLLPAEVGRQPTHRNVVLERLEPHQGGCAKLLVRKSHSLQPGIEVSDGLSERDRRQMRQAPVRQKAKNRPDRSAGPAAPPC